MLVFTLFMNVLETLSVNIQKYDTNTISKISSDVNTQTKINEFLITLPFE